jgi:integrase
MKLDKANVLTVTSDKPDAIFFDDDLPGFGVRVRGEVRTFVAQFRVEGRTRRVSLGDVRKISLEAARKAARKHFASAVLGDDVAARRAADRAKPTLGQVVDLYLAARRPQVRATSFREISRYLAVAWRSLHGTKVGKVERADIAAGLKRIAQASGPTSADRAKVALSTMFTWAMREGMCGQNPTIATNKQAIERPRDRVLKDDELAAIWRALPENDYGRILRLLALTGCRRDEIGALRWSEIDAARGCITVPASRSKNKREHKVYLSDSAMAVLATCPRREGRDQVFGLGKGPFSGWSFSKTALDAAIAKATGARLAPWRLHDIRRTCATGMGELQVFPHVIEQVLGHYSGHKAGVAGTYNWAAYEPQVRAALTLWAAHITKITEGTAKLVPLRKAESHPGFLSGNAPPRP